MIGRWALGVFRRGRGALSCLPSCLIILLLSCFSAQFGRTAVAQSKSKPTLTVSPTTATKAVGQTQQFTAMFGTTDVTSSAKWTSSNTAAATINASGLATTLAPGNATITARYKGRTATATLTVVARSLVSISVTPTNPSVAKGLTQQFTATGTYNDGSTQDITASVSWASSSTA